MKHLQQSLITSCYPHHHQHHHHIIINSPYHHHEPSFYHTSALEYYRRYTRPLPEDRIAEVEEILSKAEEEVRSKFPIQIINYLWCATIRFDYISDVPPLDSIIYMMYHPFKSYTSSYNVYPLYRSYVPYLRKWSNDSKQMVCLATNKRR